MEAKDVTKTLTLWGRSRHEVTRRLSAFERALKVRLGRVVNVQWKSSLSGGYALAVVYRVPVVVEAGGRSGAGLAVHQVRRGSPVVQGGEDSPPTGCVA